MISPSQKNYDAVVIGAGIVGLACAWRAAERGLSVLVLERDEPGAGASGVAAGMLAPVTEADFGDEQLLRANLRSRELWPGFAAELEESSGLSTGYSESGALVVAADRDDAEELRRLHEYQRSLGLDASWLTPSACRREEPGLSPRVGGGILAPQDGHVDPRATVGALAAALERAGGELRSGAEVVGLELDGGRVSGVRTAGGRVGTERVVLAAGCWSGEGIETGGPLPPVRPVKGQLLELRTRQGGRQLSERIVRTPRCYLVSRGDGRVVLGATVEEQGFDTAVTADAIYRLLEAAWEVLPEVSELELVAARAGLRPGTPDNLPLIGPAEPEGLLLATGHYRNGVLLAPLTGQAVAELLAGGALPGELAGLPEARA
jgi:glycine oxidase